MLKQHNKLLKKLNKISKLEVKWLCFKNTLIPFKV
ncbi:hypothetical protein FPSM_02331 [Flavobacterium psychrophilum]|nr:hypothetical protein FPSM_02331 [Flavobacterium psychrophilum]